MFIVLEVCDRDLDGFYLCDTLEKAIDKANELLKDHCDTIGYSDDFEALETAREEGDLVTLLNDDIRFATKRDPNAWCNLGDMDWDAHVIEVYPEEASSNVE